MPDIGTALRNALASKPLIQEINQWDDEENRRMQNETAPKQPQPTASEQPEQPQRKTVKITTLSERIFEYVRDNPNSYGKEVIDALSKEGFNPTSTASLLTQYVRAKMAVKDAAGRYTMLIQKYAPIRIEPLKQPKDVAAARKEDYRRRIEKRKLTLAAKREAVARAIDSGKSGIAVLHPEPTKTVAPTPTAKPTTNVQEMLNSLPLLQARALYDELKKLFGQ